jgi:general secretion pathway protein G
MRWVRKSAAGFTFVELVVATAVMMILASAALPVARVSIKRQREKDLRYTLREMRTAIDKFKDYADTNRIAQYELQFGSENYPASLEQLVEGVAVANDTTGRKLKFLRRIPIDPVTGRAEWGMRAYQDSPDTRVWGGQNVYDVYSKAEGIALDGTKYRDW